MTGPHPSFHRCQRSSLPTSIRGFQLQVQTHPSVKNTETKREGEESMESRGRGRQADIKFLNLGSCKVASEYSSSAAPLLSSVHNTAASAA